MPRQVTRPALETNKHTHTHVPVTSRVGFIDAVTVLGSLRHVLGQKNRTNTVTANSNAVVPEGCWET